MNIFILCIVVGQKISNRHCVARQGQTSHQTRELPELSFGAVGGFCVSFPYCSCDTLLMLLILCVTHQQHPKLVFELQSIQEASFPSILQSQNTLYSCARDVVMLGFSPDNMVPVSISLEPFSRTV